MRVSYKVAFVSVLGAVVAGATRDQAFAAGCLVTGGAVVVVGSVLTIAGRYRDSARRTAAR